MIPDYLRYHGAALVELVASVAPRTVNIRSLGLARRTDSYLLNDLAAVHIKHCAARLRPWTFAFQRHTIRELSTLQTTANSVFVILVCGTDGLCLLSLAELVGITLPCAVDSLWVRADRRRREQYAVSGSSGRLPRKKPLGLTELIRALEGQVR